MGMAGSSDLARPAPQAIVVFGASGDLTRRKILPALYNLAVEDLLPDACTIIGYAYADMDDESFRAHARRAVEEFSRTPLRDELWERFATRLQFVSGKFDDPEAFVELAARLARADAELGCRRARLYYLATPPSAFPVIATQLGAMPGGPGDPDRTGLVIEKPFGHDKASARALNATLHDVFAEAQIFRIDHYLGKETVQNIMVFRFANALWERVWNRDAIDHIQFTVAESIGVEGRGGYYEEAGALRDLLQNHMLQVLAFLTMEAPRSLEPEAFRDEKVKLLKAIRPLRPDDVVRGQYARGRDERGRDVPGFREEPSVSPDSATETFVAARLFIDNWRWAGVPIFLRHGKRLPRRASEVTVVFRDAPAYLFADLGIPALPANHVTIRVQPDEGISFSFQAKEPGPGVRLQDVEMDFSYGASFRKTPAEAYERLLHDAMEGDHTLFTREDGVERSWEVVSPVLEAPGSLHAYEAGTWGPAAADALIEPRTWHLGGE